MKTVTFCIPSFYNWQFQKYFFFQMKKWCFVFSTGCVYSARGHVTCVSSVCLLVVTSLSTLLSLEEVSAPVSPSPLPVSTSDNTNSNLHVTTCIHVNGDPPKKSPMCRNIPQIAVQCISPCFLYHLWLCIMWHDFFGFQNSLGRPSGDEKYGCSENPKHTFYYSLISKAKLNIDLSYVGKYYNSLFSEVS